MAIRIRLIIEECTRHTSASHINFTRQRHTSMSHVNVIQQCHMSHVMRQRHTSHVNVTWQCHTSKSHCNVTHHMSMLHGNVTHQCHTPMSHRNVKLLCCRSRNFCAVTLNAFFIRLYNRKNKLAFFFLFPYSDSNRIKNRK